MFQLFAVFGLQIFSVLAKGHKQPVNCLYSHPAFVLQTSEFLLAHLFGRFPIVFGKMKAVNHNLCAGRFFSYGFDEAFPWVAAHGMDRFQ